MLLLLTSCSSIMTAATSGLADSLGDAILNQDDPETVRDGAPAYLLMLDSFVRGAPDDTGTLRAAAELYAAYGIVFVEDPERAKRLTTRSRIYGRQALCAGNIEGCGLWDLPFGEFSSTLDSMGEDDVENLYTLALSWLSHIQAHRSDWAALAELPNTEAILNRVRALDDSYKPADVERYLAVMNTLRPPALGGDFDKGMEHFERAIALSGGQDLGAKVDFAVYYARTLYDQELHDRLLNEVLAADPVQEGRTLFNVLAQRDAKTLLETGADYF
jgi:ribosomal protein S15P/S13E